MTAAALLFVLAAAAQAGAAAPVPAEVPVAGAARGGWRMALVTIVDSSGPLPVIGGTRCTLRRAGVEIVIGRNLSVRVGGPAIEIAVADIVALELGGKVYETRTLPTSIPTERYRDVDYPPGFADPATPPGENVLAVRRDPGQPWLVVHTLINELVEAPALAIRHRARSGAARVRLPLAGLGRALRWCETMSESDRARRLRPR